MEHKTLEETVYSKICELCAQGDALVERKQFEQAFGFYRDALNLIPSPTEDWEATTWILTAIGDLYFLAEMTELARKTFEDVVRCPGGLENPFIHLRLGQCYFNLGLLDQAVDELTRAYMGAGREIFEKEDSKYFKFLETRIQPPLGKNKI